MTTGIEQPTDDTNSPDRAEQSTQFADIIANLSATICGATISATVETVVTYAEAVEKDSPSYTLPIVEQDDHFRQYGEVSDEILNHKISVGVSKGQDARFWKNADWDIRGFINAHLDHKVGDKDGNCFLGGHLEDTERRLASVSRMDLLVYDFDTGERIEEIRARLMALGWFGLIYTTHSHMKTFTPVKRDVVAKHVGKEENPETVTLEDAVAYLREVKRYRPWVLEGASCDGEFPWDSGPTMVITHQPMPKYRVVLVPKEPFKFGSRKGGVVKGRQEWKALYLGGARLIEAVADRSCTDPPRLYFAPRHPKGATEYFVEVIAGDFVDLEKLPRVTDQELRDEGKDAYELAARDMVGGKGGEPVTPGLKAFVGKHNKHFEICDFINAHAPDTDRGPMSSGSGRVFKCPNDGQHSNAEDPEDKGFYAVNSSMDEHEKGFRAGCKHDACRDIDRQGFLDLLCVQFGVKHADELVNDEFLWREADEVTSRIAVPADAIKYRDATALVRALPPIDDPSFLSKRDELVRRVGDSLACGVFSDEQLNEWAEAAGNAVKGTTTKGWRKQVRTYIERHCEDIANNVEGGLSRDDYHPFKGDVFVATKGGGGLIARVKDDGSIGTISLASWTNLHKHRKVPPAKGSKKDAKPVPLTVCWMNEVDNVKCRGFEFKPSLNHQPVIKSDDGELYLNRYTGIPLDPIPGDTSRIDRVILEVLANGNPERADYITAWMAYNLQFLGKVHDKLPIWLVFKGTQGAGKSSVWEVYSKIFGRYGVTIDKSEQLTASFNALLGETLFVLGEEAVFAYDEKTMNILKQMATGQKINITYKGLDTIVCDNYLFGVLVGNGDAIINFDDANRRFAYFETSDALVKNANPKTPEEHAKLAEVEAFWTAFYKSVNDGSLVSALAQKLMTYKPKGGDWGFLRRPPVTKEGDELVARNLSGAERALLQWAYQCDFDIENGTYDNAAKLSDVNGQTVQLDNATLYKAVKEWIGENGTKHDKMPEKAGFGTLLSEMFPRVEVKRNSSTRYRVFPSNGELIEMLRSHPKRSYGAYLDILERGGA